LADGVWFGFLFTSSALVSKVFRERVDNLLHARGRAVVAVDVREPAQWASVLPTLFSPDPAHAGCVWVECVGVDLPTRAETDDASAGERPAGERRVASWRAAVEQLFLRVNERRDAVLRHLSGGLVFALHPSMKPLVRDAAPDLWSMRSLVLDTTAPPTLAHPASAEYPQSDRERDHPRDDERADSARVYLGTRLSPTAASGELGRLLRRLERELADENAATAAETGLAALEHLDTDTPATDRLAVLVWLGRAEEEAGDAASAVDHVEAALAELDALPDGHTIPTAYRRELLERAARLAEDRGDLPATLTARMALVDAARRRTADEPRSVEAASHLRRTLNDLGDVHRDAGATETARAAYTESLDITRRLLAAHGETPTTLRDLSVGLDKVGDVHRDAGDTETARAAYTESLDITRRLLAAHGETPTTLRDLSVGLDKVGRVRESSGDQAGAAEAFEDALAVDRRRRELYGDRPQVIDDLAVSLEQVARLRDRLGDADGAAAARAEAARLRTGEDEHRTE
jgi:tetratricopeptide (TPR) repeat protein